MSIDSAKDSGIGCSSTLSEDEKILDRKINLIEYLPPNSYFRHNSRCYVFPGAEIYFNSDDDDEDDDNDCDDDDEDDNDINDSGHFTQYDDEDSTFGPIPPSRLAEVNINTVDAPPTPVSDVLEVLPMSTQNICIEKISTSNKRPAVEDESESKWSKCNFSLGKDFGC